MSDELPRRRTLDSLKKEAKRWLEALRHGTPAARTRLEQAFPAATASPTLRDVQHALAREQGFPGWTDLKRHLESGSTPSGALLREYQEKADALLEAYRTGAPAAMERHWALTWHRRPWKGMRTYVQLDLGRQVGSPFLDDDISLDDARYLVAREHGFEHWDALTRHCATHRPATEPPLRQLALASHGRMTDAMLEELAELGSITELRAGRSLGVTNAGLRAIGRMTQLTHLDLSGTSVTDAGVRHLVRNEQLKDVNLQWTSTGDGALRSLAELPRLSHLRTGTGVTDDGLALLREFAHFGTWQGGEAEMALTSHEAGPNYLLLRGSFTDRGMQHLARLDGLFALNVDAAELGITAAGLLPLIGLPRLGWLAIDATDESMKHVARMPHLRFLGCQDTVASDDGFEALGGSRTIEHIWGRRCRNLRSRGFRALGDIPTLCGLSVSCLNVSDDAVATLPAFPALRELMPMDIPDAGYRHIGKCERLDSLVLMYCRETTDVATEHITGLPALKKYFASYTRITDRTPELLSTIPTLESVTFDKCAGVTNAGIRKLSGLPRLKELAISGQQVTAEVAAAFGPDVSVHYSL